MNILCTGTWVCACADSENGRHSLSISVLLQTITILLADFKGNMERRETTDLDLIKIQLDLLYLIYVAQRGFLFQVRDLTTHRPIKTFLWPTEVSLEKSMMVASSLIRKCHCTPECVRSSQPVSVVGVLLIPWLVGWTAKSIDSVFSGHQTN